jgi:hypothetical protein
MIMPLFPELYPNEVEERGQGFKDSLGNPFVTL